MPRVVTDSDRALLRRAIELAEEGRGRVSPNPLVGAVLARPDSGEVIGEGFHAERGDVHAEVAAIADCRQRGEDPAGATLFVSLEPCAHRGLQPPCTDAILAAGIGRVVVASDDPTPKASGRGPGILRDEGVTVEFAEGAEATRARLLNQPFRKRARTGRPLVVLKSAVSVDGFTASPDRVSKWISGDQSRGLVHRWRGESRAVCVGIGTALADDPLLTARPEGGDPARQPLRVVFDSGARLPLDSRLVASAAETPVCVIAAAEAPPERVAALRGVGLEVIQLSGDRPRRVVAALDELGAREIDSLFLEGGATLAGAFLDAGEIDELRIFIAPILLGSGRPLLAGSGTSPAETERLLSFEWERSGEDLLARGRLREW